MGNMVGTTYTRLRCLILARDTLLLLTCFSLGDKRNMSKTSLVLPIRHELGVAVPRIDNLDTICKMPATTQFLRSGSSAHSQWRTRSALISTVNSVNSTSELALAIDRRGHQHLSG